MGRNNTDKGNCLAGADFANSLEENSIEQPSKRFQLNVDCLGLTGRKGAKESVQAENSVTFRLFYFDLFWNKSLGSEAVSQARNFKKGTQR